MALTYSFSVGNKGMHYKGLCRDQISLFSTEKQFVEGLGIRPWMESLRFRTEVVL